MSSSTRDSGIEGHGLTFTIGRGNDICCAAIEAMRHLVVGLELDWVKENPGRFWRHLTGDSQLRWIGPDKGAMHLATGAVVNAVWDLWAKEAGKPVWRLVADMSPEEIVEDRRLPLSHRRADAGRSARHPAPRRARQGRAHRRRSSARAMPATRPRPAGSAMPTTSCGGSARRRSTPASTTSR